MKTDHAPRNASGSGEAISVAERRVLNVFRKFLMAPGQMLCFYGNDLTQMRAPISQLIAKELLVAEKFKGGYSLTHAGFEAMRHEQATR